MMGGLFGPPTAEIREDFQIPNGRVEVVCPT
jgi:hypothetical protein